MKPTDEQRAQWVDGTLSHDDAERVESWLDANPAEKDEMLQMRAISRAVGESSKPPADLPAAEFFMHQLERRLDAVDSEQVLDEGNVITPAASMWKRFVVPSLSAAAVAVFATIITLQVAKEPVGVVAAADESRELQGVYAPQDSVKIDAFYSDDADAQVVILEGLPAIEDDVVIAGFGLESERTRNHWAGLNILQDALASVPKRTVIQ